VSRLRDLVRRVVPVAVLAAWLLIAAAPARAELGFRPCAGTPDYDCAKLPVPLDPAAPDGEQIALEVRRLTETREGRGVLVALAGGPGQSSTSFIDDFADVLAEGLVDRQLVVVDLRGTGASGALRCSALDGAPDVLSLAALTARVGACGEQLGARRRHFTTTEAVADLELLRRELGVERLSLFGVSHGSYVAQRYARAHPEQVDRLVLDSPVAQDQGGAFDTSTYRAVGRVLRALCRGGACRGVEDPVADVRRLARRLSRGTLSARVTDARGRLRVVRLAGAGELLDLLVSTDFSAALRGALPAAVHAAARGDAVPLLRLVALERGSDDPRAPDTGEEPAEEFSNALFFATTCQEKPLPWAPDAPVSGRSERRAAALSHLPPDALAPFTHAAAGSTQVGSAFCSAWPPTTVAVPPAPAEIPATALVLSGARDLRTPAAEARRTAAGIRDGTLVVVPGVGHAVVGWRAPCVERALRRFFLGDAVGNPCVGRRVAGAPPSPVAPQRARRVPRAGLRGDGATIAAAVLVTVEDAVRLAAIPAVLDERFRAGGLRGGTLCVAPGPRGTDGARPLVVKLRRARYVRDLAVTGRATVDDGRLTTMTVRLRGQGERRGTLRLRDGRLVGELGQRAIAVGGGRRRAMPSITVAAVVGRQGC
jgi:pimeloyl-ACP methyl ester carboxylesterase